MTSKEFQQPIHYLAQARFHHLPQPKGHPQVLRLPPLRSGSLGITLRFDDLRSPAGEEPLHELRVELAGAEVFVGEDFLVKRDRGVDSLHHELAESARSILAMASARSTPCTISLAISES